MRRSDEPREGEDTPMPDETDAAPVAPVPPGHPDVATADTEPGGQQAARAPADETSDVAPPPVDEDATPEAAAGEEWDPVTAIGRPPLVQVAEQSAKATQEALAADITEED